MAACWGAHLLNLVALPRGVYLARYINDLPEKWDEIRPLIFHGFLPLVSH